jgi:ferritin
MISSTMQKALNNQIALEGYASFLYLSMSVWCDSKGLEGCASFMQRQSEEERMHMLKIFHYMSEVDAFANTPAIAQVPVEFDAVQAMFEQVYAHEQKVSAAIHNLVALSLEEKDHNTGNFLQWFVEEQREEEALMRAILDKIRLIGNGSMSLYYIDKEVAAINAQAIKAEAAEKA